MGVSLPLYMDVFCRRTGCFTAILNLTRTVAPNQRSNKHSIQLYLLWEKPETMRNIMLLVTWEQLRWGLCWKQWLRGGRREVWGTRVLHGSDFQDPLPRRAIPNPPRYPHILPISSATRPDPSAQDPQPDPNPHIQYMSSENVKLLTHVVAYLSQKALDVGYFLHLGGHQKPPRRWMSLLRKCYWKCCILR